MSPEASPAPSSRRSGLLKPRPPARGGRSRARARRSPPPAGTAGARDLAREAGCRLAMARVLQQRHERPGDAARSGQPVVQREPEARMHDARRDTRLVEGDRQGEDRHPCLGRVEHGVEPGVTDDDVGARDHLALGEVRHDVIAPDLRRLSRREPAAMGDDQLRSDAPAGPRDPPEQAEAMALQRAETGVDERPAAADRRQRRVFRPATRRPQRPDGMDRRRHRPPGEIEPRHDLPDRGQRGHAVLEPRPLPPRRGFRRDRRGKRAHEPVRHAGAAGVARDAPGGGIVAPGEHRQRQLRFALHAERGRHRHEGQAQPLGHERARRLHLVDEDRVGADPPHHVRCLPGQPSRRLRHVLHHPRHAERKARVGRPRHDAPERLGTRPDLREG
jgi:hypothetical protein